MSKVETVNMGTKKVADRTSISISKATYARLISKGVFGDSIEDIVVRCLDAHDKELKSKGKL